MLFLCGGEFHRITLLGYGNDWTFTGMAPDYLPRISSKSCGYPFTYLGGLYHRCVENMENVTSACERWGCFALNYSAAICAADVGKTPHYQAELATYILLPPGKQNGNDFGDICLSVCLFVCLCVCL